MDYNFIKHVYEEPEAILATLTGSGEHIKEVCSNLRRKAFDTVILTGCGSSNNAAICAEYAFSCLLNLNVKAIPSSEIILYPEGYLNQKKLVIAISRSGEKGDSISAARKARAEGATVIAVTAESESLLAREANEVILTFEGPEYSQPKTKSVITTVEALILFAIEFSDIDTIRKNELIDQLKQISEVIHELTESHEKTIQTIAGKHKDAAGIMLTGAGAYYGTAVEASLKLKETCQIHAEAFATGEVAQGPLLLLNDEWLYISLATGESFDHALKLLSAAKKKCACTVVLTSEPAKVGNIPDYIIDMPELDKNIFACLVYLVPLQLLTYYISQAKGLNADEPEGFDLILDLILEPGRTEPEMKNMK